MMAQLEEKTISNIKALSQSLLYLHEYDQVCDVIFEVGDEKELVNGASTLLVARSRVFRSLLLTELQEAQSKKTPKSIRKKSGKDRVRISIPKYEKKDFLPLVQFAHSGRCQIEARYVIGLLACAREYEFPSLEQACSSFLARRTTPDNICYLLTEYYRYQLQAGVKETKTILNYFAAAYAEKIVQFCSFLTLPRGAFQEILLSSKLASRELTKFRSCLLWCKYQVSQSKQNNDDGEDPFTLPDSFRPFLTYFNLTKIPVRNLLEEVRKSTVVPERLIAHACAHNTCTSELPQATWSFNSDKTNRPPSLLGSDHVIEPSEQPYAQDQKYKQTMIGSGLSSLLRIPKSNRTLKAMSKLALSTPCLEGLI